MLKGLGTNARPEPRIPAVWVARHHDDLGSRVHSLYAVGQLHAVHQGHDDIGQQEIDRLGLRDPEGLVRVAGFQDRIPKAQEGGPGNRPDIRVVIDHQDRFSHCGSSASIRQTVWFTTGARTHQVLAGSRQLTRHRIPVEAGHG